MREIRLDVIRGLAMLTIAANHMTYLLSQVGYKGPSLPTLTSLGFSSSAEIFFLMSGYMVGLIYVPRPGITQKTWARARKIYIYNLAVFAIVVALSLVMPPEVIVATDLDYWWAQPIKATAMFVGLLQHPYLLGVLQVYVVLMLLTPLAAIACRTNVAALLLVSFLIYLPTQLLPEFNLPGGAPKEDWLWNFNPVAWQFLFCIGIALGFRSVHKALFEWIDRSPINTLIPLALFIILAPVFFLHSRGYFEFPLTDKTNLGFLRLLHVFVAVVAMASISTFLLNWLPTWVGNQVGIIGKNTLDCYTSSIPATYLLAAFWVWLGLSGIPAYLCVIAAILLSTLVVAYVREWLVKVRSTEALLAPPRR